MRPERSNERKSPGAGRPNVLFEAGDGPPDLAVIDVSFISLMLVLPKVVTLLVPGSDIIALIKPQAAGGVASDATEAHALRQVFAPLPALVSLKAALGHTLAPVGAPGTSAARRRWWPLKTNRHPG